MKKIILLLVVAIFHLPFSISHATVWQVGPTHTYTKPSQVSSLVQNGDTVDIDAGTYTADVCHWTANNLLLRGVGTGYAHLNANNTSYGQKGIWVIGGNNTTVRYIEFSHCHDVAAVDKNWAGIRQEGMNLTVSHCYFHDNDDGILAGTLNPSKIVIQFTEFDHNGFGDGYSHNLYINHVDTLVFRYNYSHHATIGHELKSRAHVNYILYNRLSNEATGDASREIDMPDGGTAIVMGNIVEQGPNSTNSGIIGYGLESLTNNAPHDLYLVNNTIVNDKSSGVFVQVGNVMNIFKSRNNILAGIGAMMFGTPVTLDTASNWHPVNISSAGFVSAATYDYHLTIFSPAINSGTNAGVASNGFSLTPLMEYSHPANSVARVVSLAIDLGAHEFGSATGVNDNSNLKDEFQYWAAEGSLTVATSIPLVVVTIYDAFGRKIIEKKIQSGISQIDVSSLSQGIYILEARTENGAVSGKFFR